MQSKIAVPHGTSRGVSWNAPLCHYEYAVMPQGNDLQTAALPIPHHNILSFQPIVSDIYAGLPLQLPVFSCLISGLTWLPDTIFLHDQLERKDTAMHNRKRQLGRHTYLQIGELNLARSLGFGSFSPTMS